MLADIELDVLHFLDRSALEGFQVHSRYLRDVVNRHARSFPLRYIREVEVIHGNVHIRVSTARGFQRFVPLAPCKEDVKVLFHCVNNAFVHRLAFDFRPKNLSFLSYLRANANVLQCQLGTLNVKCSEAEIDYALLDFVGVNHRHQVYKTSMCRNFYENYAMIFTRNALRGCVAQLEYGLYGIPTPDCIMPALFGVGPIQSCAITTNVDPRPWIGTLLRTFGTAERGTDIVRSVTLLYERWGDVTPLHHSGDVLGKPRRRDVPTPRSDFIQEWSRKPDLYGRTTVAKSTVPDLFVFENAKLAKKLDVFLWAIEEKYDAALNALHYVFLIQVADM